MHNSERADQRGLLYEPLKDGLVLRQATPDDGPQIIEFNRVIFGTDSAVEIAALLEGAVHPGFKLEDFLVVVDGENRVVSSLCLLEVEWQFGQTKIRVGQPEFVCTAPEYRGRGLVRLQMEVLHRWMQERGLAFAVIGGIYYYYRLFGYEYALDMGRTGTLTREQHLPSIKMPDDVEVRLIQESDAPALVRLQEEANAHIDISMKTSEEAWRWSARVRRYNENMAEDWIALQNGQPIGTARVLLNQHNIFQFRYFYGNAKAAQALIAQTFALPNIDKVWVMDYPDSVVGQWAMQFQPTPLHPYAWYMRINDPLLAFQQLRGEFERRIAASPFAGLTRELILGMYRFGLKLDFQDGEITDISQIAGSQDPQNGVPPDMLPKLLMGYRDIDFLRQFAPDLVAREDWGLLKVLFPPLRNSIRFLI